MSACYPAKEHIDARYHWLRRPDDPTIRRAEWNMYVPAEWQHCCFAWVMFGAEFKRSSVDVGEEGWTWAGVVEPPVQP